MDGDNSCSPNFEIRSLTDILFADKSLWFKGLAHDENAKLSFSLRGENSENKPKHVFYREILGKDDASAKVFKKNSTLIILIYE